MKSGRKCWTGPSSPGGSACGSQCATGAAEQSPRAPCSAPSRAPGRRVTTRFARPLPAVLPRAQVVSVFDAMDQAGMSARKAYDFGLSIEPPANVLNGSWAGSGLTEQFRCNPNLQQEIIGFQGLHCSELPLRAQATGAAPRGNGKAVRIVNQDHGEHSPSSLFQTTKWRDARCCIGSVANWSRTS